MSLDVQRVEHTLDVELCIRCDSEVVVAYDEEGRRFLLDPRMEERYVIVKGSARMRRRPTFKRHACART